MERNINLQGCLQDINPQRFRPRGKGNEITYRTGLGRAFEYVINLPKKCIKVCQRVFVTIHGIKRDRLVCKVQHQEKDISDGRGHQRHPKFDVEYVKEVHES